MLHLHLHLRLFRHRRRDLDQRVQAAQQEAEQSRQALENTRKDVTRLRDITGRNHFADLIRASLKEGRHSK